MKMPSVRGMPKASCCIGIFIYSLLSPAHASDSWEVALARMPLPNHVHELNWTNCVEVMLRAFQSNSTVRALVFLPGATDELYMFHRAQARLSQSTSTLLDCVVALTNQTLIRATFCAPVLLLHTAADPLEPPIKIEHQRKLQRLHHPAVLPYALAIDRDWDFLQPILKKNLKLDIRPWKHSNDSWHFYRHNFAVWNLSGWEALETAALAGKTGFTLRRRSVVFEPDRRTREAPKPNAFPQ